MQREHMQFTDFSCFVLNFMHILIVYMNLQVLTGHKEDAEFALAMCPTAPFVLSGGRIWVLLNTFIKF